jgi:rRNA maturation endonuclease Nob1
MPLEEARQGLIPQDSEGAKNGQEIAAVLRSTIKVRCRYCGKLNDKNDSHCESCGAVL